MIVLPCVWLVRCRDYTERVSKDMLVISLMTSTVGVCSVYFHATLSMMGQLLDELSILWSLMTGLALWLPEYHFPRFCKGKRYVIDVKKV